MFVFVIFFPLFFLCSSFAEVELSPGFFTARHDRALEDNPTLPFATAPELFPDPGRNTESRVGSYFGNQKALSW